MIDSHIHLDMPDFDPDREAVLERSVAAGVDRWIIPATTPDTASRLLAAEWLRPSIHPSAGIHPHQVKHSSEADLDRVEAIARDPRVVAVGETGLDYFYDTDDAPRQGAFLDRHFAIAELTGKPLILHVRNGEGRSALDHVLERIAGSRAIGVLHAYTGGVEPAMKAMERGWYIGLGGILTFKKSEDLRRTAAELPTDRILLETDAPYLAPQPFRGKRNEPAWLERTLQVLASIKMIAPSDLALWITRNTEGLFSLTLNR